jgi:hypothetical protein
MNRSQQWDHAVDARPFGDAPVTVVFFAMAVAEWRRLVADVSRLFVGKRSRRAAISEKRVGRCRLPPSAANCINASNREHFHETK